MVIVHGLRILTDLAFYYAFASYLSVCFGGRYAMIGMLVQAACFTLSAALREKPRLRLAVLLPVMLLWLLPGIGVADSVLFLGPAIYLVWQAWKGKYPVEWNRQVELFSVFLKVYTCVAAFLLLSGMLKPLSAASLPCALIMLVCSVLLMRTLRHEPETYCQRRYQLVNLVSVAVVTAVAALISTEAFLKSCLAALGSLYNTLVLPLLMLLLTAFVYLLRGVAWLLTLLNLKLPEESEKIELDLMSAADILGQEVAIQEWDVGKEVLIVLLTILGAVALYFFFRWMSRLGWGEEKVAAVGEKRGVVDAVPEKAEKPPRFGSPVQRVRAQYRKFLKLYLAEGGGMEKFHTSLDIQKEAGKFRLNAEASGELREIYIRARYADDADARDAARARELYSAIKKEKK